MKVCCRCKEEKAIEDFAKNTSRCKACDSKRVSACMKKKPELYKAINTKSYHKRKKKITANKYGMTEDEYQNLILKQRGKCAICYGSNVTEGLPLFVDHDHKTGKVRGLLCKACNSGLGLFKDKETLLSKAIAYLQNAS